MTLRKGGRLPQNSGPFADIDIFGLGSHYCLGAPLARLEGQIAILALISRFPNLSLTVPVEALGWRRGFVLRGLEKLPVRSG